MYATPPPPQHYGSTYSRLQRRDGTLRMVELKPDMSLCLALGVVIGAVDVKHVTDRSQGLRLWQGGFWFPLVALNGGVWQMCRDVLSLWLLYHTGRS